jgi:hypothetical protein
MAACSPRPAVLTRSVHEGHDRLGRRLVCSWVGAGRGASARWMRCRVQGCRQGAAVAGMLQQAPGARRQRQAREAARAAAGSGGSAPPSFRTAALKRVCSSGVHRSRSLEPAQSGLSVAPAHRPMRRPGQVKRWERRQAYRSRGQAATLCSARLPARPGRGRTAGGVAGRCAAAAAWRIPPHRWGAAASAMTYAADCVVSWPLLCLHRTAEGAAGFMPAWPG